MSKKAKKLIVIRGPICSGKSTVAKLLRDSLPNASWIDYEVFKRMIDPVHSSVWRHKLAFHTAVSLVEDLMDAKRTIILEIHASNIYQYSELQKLAEAHRYEFRSVLLMPPLAICLRRSKLRAGDVLPEKKVREYWYSSFRLEDEPVFDTSQISPEEIAEHTLSFAGVERAAGVTDII